MQQMRPSRRPLRKLAPCWRSGAAFMLSSRNRFSVKATEQSVLGRLRQGCDLYWQAFLFACRLTRRKRGGECKGFGFVKYGDQSTAERACVEVKEVAPLCLAASVKFAMHRPDEAGDRALLPDKSAMEAVGPGKVPNCEDSCLGSIAVALFHRLSENPCCRSVANQWECTHHGAELLMRPSKPVVIGQSRRLLTQRPASTSCCSYFAPTVTNAVQWRQH